MVLWSCVVWVLLLVVVHVRVSCGVSFFILHPSTYSYLPPTYLHKQLTDKAHQCWALK